MADCVIGIDLGGTNVRLALVGRQGEVLYRDRWSTQVEQGFDRLIGRLSEQILSACDRGPQVGAVGIGTPGAVLFDEGIVTTSPNFPDWEDVPLKTILEKALEEKGLSVAVDNDANLIALAEAWQGAAKGAKSVVCFTLGTGVGGGIVLGDQVWRGFLGMAGEVGHLTIDPDGPLCGCGNHGCVEVFASATGLSNQVRAALAEGALSALSGPAARTDGVIPAREIFECAVAGDRLAKDVLERFGWGLGVGVANVINVLNVQRVVIAGGISQAWDLYRDAMFREVRAHVYSIAGERTEILPAALGDDAGVIGAARIAWASMEDEKI